MCVCVCVCVCVYIYVIHKYEINILTHQKSSVNNNIARIVRRTISNPGISYYPKAEDTNGNGRNYRIWKLRRQALQS